MWGRDCIQQLITDTDMTGCVRGEVVDRMGAHVHMYIVVVVVVVGSRQPRR